MTITDRLSIAAGIVGILTAAQQVSFCIETVVSEAKKASEQMSELNPMVDYSIYAVLSRLQASMLGQARPEQTRTRLILIGQSYCHALSMHLDLFTKMGIISKMIANFVT